jgi:hypothetical protein
MDPYAPLLQHHKYLFRLSKSYVKQFILKISILFLINILQRLNEEMNKLSSIHSTLLIRNQILVEIADDNRNYKEEEKKERGKGKLTE